MYYVIHVNEDGEVSAGAFSKETLEERLNENYWGNPKFLSDMDIRPHQDVQEWGGNTLLIIKGDVVLPQAVRIITKRVLP